MTLPLPSHDGTNLQAILDLIAQSFIDTGKRSLKLRFGNATVTWAGGTPTCNTQTVTHGMGSTPVHIHLTPKHDGAGKYLGCNWLNAGATSFDITATTVDASNPAAAATQTISWIALG